MSQTNSILSDPDGRWVAKRQGAINEAFEKRGRSENSQGAGATIASHNTQHDGAMPDDASAKLSGESDRIGRLEWDEYTPFGEHVCFL
ncbi:hypothetical protein CEJ86_01065 [Sinorhizobium meliloti]|uniref:Uncharacterized protein n=1 Tax=Rhizobium meliloti TaxID=382 RepID=A0A2J0Z8H9_RHIML|nr:hypothetical protein CEJ86_01065 [Sinorhizobium meliloti]